MKELKAGGSRLLLSGLAMGLLSAMPDIPDLVVRLDDDDPTKRADADIGSKLDRVLTGLDSVSRRLDANDQALAALRKRADDDDARRDDEACVSKYSDRKDDDDDDSYKKRHDAEEEAERKEREGKGESKEMAADKAKKHRKDADERDAKMMADKKRKDDDEAAKKKADADDAKKRADAATAAGATDAAVLSRLAALEGRTAVRSDADIRELSTAQEKADTIFRAFGDSASAFMQGESLQAYRVRLAAKLQKHSPTWKDIDLHKLADSAPAFAVAEQQIYADAALAAKTPTDLPDTGFREVRRTDSVSGHRITEFHGRHSFVRGFSTPSRKVAQFLVPGATRR